MKILSISTFLAVKTTAYSDFDFWTMPEIGFCYDNPSVSEMTSDHITQIDMTKGPYGNIFGFTFYQNG